MGSDRLLESWRTWGAVGCGRVRKHGIIVSLSPPPLNWLQEMKEATMAAVEIHSCVDLGRFVAVSPDGSLLR